MKSATLTVTSPFLLSPSIRPARRIRAPRSNPTPAVTSGLFARLERETTSGSLPETVVFVLLAITGAALPTWEALRIINGF